MKKIKKIFAIFLSVFMAFGGSFSMSILGTAVDTTDPVSTLPPPEQLTAEEMADYLLDALEREIVFSEPYALTENFIIRGDSLDAFIQSIAEGFTLHANELGGDVLNVDASALSGISRENGNLSFLYQILAFINDNRTIAAKIIDGSFDYGSLESNPDLAASIASMKEFDLHDMLMTVMFDKNSTEVSIDSYLNTMFQQMMVSYFAGANVDLPPDAFDLTSVSIYSFVDSVMTALVQNMFFEDVMYELVSSIREMIMQTRYPFVVGRKVEDPAQLAQAESEFYENYTLGDDVMWVGADNTYYYTTYEYMSVDSVIENSSYETGIDDLTASTSQRTLIINQFAHLLDDGTYEPLLADAEAIDNELSNMFDPFFLYTADYFDFASGLEEYGGYIEQVNHLAAQFIDLVFTEESAAAIGWQDGSTADYLNDNLSSTALYLFPKIAELLAQNGETYFSDERFQEDLTFEELAVVALQNMIVRLGADDGFDLTSIQNCNTLEQLAVCTIKEIAEKILNIPYNYDADVYSDVKSKTLQDRTDDEWLDILLTMGVDMAVYYLNQVVDIGLSPEVVMERKAEGWGHLDFLDEVMDWAINLCGGIFVAFDDVECQRGVLDGNGPWYKLSKLLNSLLPFGQIFNHCEMTYGNETLEFDLGVFLRDRILSDLMQLDISGFLSIFELQKEDDNTFYSQSIMQAALRIVQQVIHAIFPDVIPDTLLQSVDTLMENTSFITIGENLMSSLYSRSERFVPAGVQLSYFVIREVGVCLEHSYGEWTVITPASCTEEGVRSHICTVCENEDTEIIPSLGHDFSATEPGSTVRYCTRCGVQEENTEADIVLQPKPGSNITINEEEQMVSIDPQTSVDELADQLDAENIEIVDQEGNVLPDGSNAGTGCVVRVFDSNQTMADIIKEYVIMVPMDVSGDGNITSSDSRTTLRSAVSLDALEGVYNKAADANSDGKVTSADARMSLRVAVGLPVDG